MGCEQVKRRVSNVIVRLAGLVVGSCSILQVRKFAAKLAGIVGD